MQQLLPPIPSEQIRDNVEAKKGMNLSVCEKESQNEMLPTTGHVAIIISP
jgi:hypothetical protein